jgi:hypothetical protein
MALLSKPIAQVDFNFYGQKKRHKAISNVQTQVAITMNPFITDPAFLGEFAAKLIFDGSYLCGMPAKRELYWKYLNYSFKNIQTNPGNIFYIWEGFIDVSPMLVQNAGKPLTYIKSKFLENRKVTNKIHEDSPGIHYMPIAAVAFVQFVLNTLSPEQFSVFCGVFNQQVQIKRNSYKGPPAFHQFGLEEINMGQAQAPAQPQEPAAPQATNIPKFCPGCGTPVQAGANGAIPKFCSGCGNKL